MKRRIFLALCSAGLAGCLNQLEGGRSGDKTFGEVAEYEGVEATPTHWLSTDEVTFDIDQGATLTETPSRGAEFLLTRLESRNDGDHQRELPSRSGTFGGMSGRDIRIHYVGEETSTVMHEDISTTYEVNGERLIPYTRSRMDEDALGAVYPGVEVAGWTVAEITEGFDVEEVTIEIQLGGDETFEWRYSEDDRVTPEDAREIEQEDRVISM